MGLCHYRRFVGYSSTGIQFMTIAVKSSLPGRRGKINAVLNTLTDLIKRILVNMSNLETN